MLGLVSSRCARMSGATIELYVAMAAYTLLHFTNSGDVVFIVPAFHAARSASSVGDISETLCGGGSFSARFWRLSRLNRLYSSSFIPAITFGPSVAATVSPVSVAVLARSHAAPISG